MEFAWIGTTDDKEEPSKDKEDLLWNKAELLRSNTNGRFRRDV
jgi:hypothetical protein